MSQLITPGPSTNSPLTIMESVGDYNVDYSPKGLLGKGEFGHVYKAVHKESKEKVAAKFCIIPDRDESEEAQKNWEAVVREVATLKTVSKPGHHNVLTVLDHYEQAGTISQEVVLI